MENTFIDIKRMERKNLRKAASAVAILMLLFLVFCIIYDFALFYGINLAFNDEFVFKKSYMHEAAKFFYSFLPNMKMIENFTIQILSLITSFGIVQLFYKFRPMPLLSKKNTTENNYGEGKTSIPKLVGCCFCVAMGINLITSMFISAVTWLIKQLGIVLPEPNFDFGSNSFANLLIYFLSLCVFAPLIEEFLLRGCVLKILKPYGNWLAIFVSAFFFALLHGNIGQGFGAFFIGVIFGFVAVKTNSILPTIILHSLNNFYSFLSVIIQNLNHKNTMTLFYVLSSIFTMAFIVIIVLTIVFICVYRKKFKLNDNNTTSLTRKESYATLFTSVFICLYLGYEVFRFVEQIVFSN